MRCGHTANALTKNGDPYCVICSESDIAEQQKNIKNRKAKCVSCGKITESHLELPFFKSTPTKETDEYYCGCEGWE